MDQFISCFLQTFLGHQFLFIKFFSRSQSGILYFYINIRLHAGQLDQVSCQCINLHRASHIKYKDLTAMSIRSCLQHQTDSFRDRHKITDNIRMCNCDRTSCCNLLFKQRNYRSIASQHVSKTNCYKFGLDICRKFLFYHCTVFIISMCIQNWQLFRCSVFDHTVKRLDDHLAKSLACSHNICRIDRLICTDQHKSLTAIHHCCICSLVSSDRIVFDGFTRTVFHKRHMLVSSRMVHNIRFIRLKDRIDSSGIPDRTD